MIIRLKSPTRMLLSASAMILASNVVYAMSKTSFNMFKNMTDYTLIISMVTNLLATSLIAYKLWLVEIPSDVNDD